MEKADSHFQPLASQTGQQNGQQNGLQNGLHNGQHPPSPKESHSQHVPSVPSTAGNGN